MQAGGEEGKGQADSDMFGARDQTQSHHSDIMT